MYFTEKIGKNGMIKQLKIALENRTCLPDESFRQNLPNPNVAAHRIRSKFQHVENQIFFYLKSDFFFSLSWLRDFLKVMAGMSEK